MEENQISGQILDAAVRIHRALGPGLFESVYEAVLAHELRKRGFNAARQAPVPVHYEGLEFAEAYRADLVVEDKVLVELKSVERLLPIHRKQTLTYVKLKKLRLGLLINFGAEYIKEGIERVVNRLPD